MSVIVIETVEGGRWKVEGGRWKVEGNRQWAMVNGQ
jgi:hypothetical protein